MNIDAQLLNHFFLRHLHVLKMYDLLFWLNVFHFLKLGLTLLPLDFATASLTAPAFALVHAHWSIGATRGSKLSATVDLPILLDPILFSFSLLFKLFFNFHGYFVYVLNSALSRFLPLVLTHFLINLLGLGTCRKLVYK